MTEEREHGTHGEGTELEFGSKSCACPACGTEVPHKIRGVPCSKLKCPKCGAQMKGTQCTE